MKITKEDIDSLLAAKLITVKNSATYPNLRVVKYSRKVFYDNLWEKNPILVAARGLIIDEDYNTVVFPFEKVFNRNEPCAVDIPGDSQVKCVRKVNGFLGVVTYHNDYGFLYSTTGSLDSPFCQYIRDHVEKFENKLSKTHGLTYLFEIVHKDDPHIIDEIPGAYLIGMRSEKGEMISESVLDLIVESMPGILRPESFMCKMCEVNDKLKACTHEGYMVIETDHTWKQTGKIVKMKSPFYLIRKMIARKQDLNAALVNAQKVKETIEEELYVIVDAVFENRDIVQKMDEQERLKFMSEALLK